MKEGAVVRKKATAEIMVVVDPHPTDLGGFVACRCVDGKEGETSVLPEWELELLTDEEKKVIVTEPNVSERLAALEERVKQLENQFSQFQTRLG